MRIGKASTAVRSSMVFTLVVVLASSHAHAQSPPAEAFASLPAMESPSISADGTRLAFIAHTPTDNYVLVANLDGMQVTTVVEVNEGKLRSVFWASDEALVFTASAATSAALLPGRVEAAAPYGIDLTADGAVTRLLKGRRARVTRRGGGGAVMPGQAAFASSGAQLTGWERSAGRVLYPKIEYPDLDRVLYTVDPKNDQQTVVDRGSRFTRGWIVDESAQPIFRIDYAQKSDQYTLLGRRDGRWELVVSETVAIPEMSVHGLDGDDELIVRARPEGADHFGLYTLSAETGEIGEPVLVHDRLDVAGARIDPYTHRVIGSAISDEPVWFDDELAEHQKMLDDAFPGESPTIDSWSEDRRRFLVTTESAGRAPAIYLYDASEPSVTQIGSAFTDLQGVQLPSRLEYSYTARDGTSIPSYLTRPIEADGPTALVVLPHGGPASRDYGGFNWMAQFLASRGYTVLQPNFRGSAGYGKAWEEAGHGEWGIGVMQHDLSDGVAALIEQEIADPERVCIVGGSYGGYAALAGAVFTPALYRCAVAIAPVTDLAEMFRFERTRQGGLSAAVSYWRDAMGGGDPDRLNDRLRAASPAAHAERAGAAILLIHGRDDSVVPISQSREMESELRSAGKSVELIELDGEDHWLSVASTRLAALQALDRFLGEHLGN